MIVLQTTQTMLTLVGLQFKDSNRAWYKFYRLISFIILTMMLQPQISTMLSNLDDLIQVTYVFIQVSAESMSSVKALFFLYNWRTSKWLFETMQTDFDKNEKVGRIAHFLRADREASFVTKINNWFLLIAGVTFTLGPLTIIVINSIMGTLEPEMWIHPFKADFLFDYTTTPGYEIAYLMNIIYNVYVATFYGAIDTCYMGLTVYSMAYLEDFMDLFLEINNNYISHTRDLVSGDRKFLICNKQLRRDLISFIRYHYNILNFIDNVLCLMTGIIFTQFCGVVFTLSTIAYQITLSNDGTVLIYMGPCVAVLLQLFMYCYYGQMLSHKGLEMVDNIYQSNWCMFPVEYQHFVGLIMVRLQRPIVMSGFNVVACDLPTFVSVLKSVTSVLALFQSMQE